MTTYEDEWFITVELENGTATYDKETGMLISYIGNAVKVNIDYLTSDKIK